ncbi:hypothetical protein ACJMK2_007052 [Sinanodonta woodiana]|uniref:Uncharacterized protein n=1 Tax=Sinanodonta woodiana TaxID=1069815 RepID=A0ABD3VIT0_SINWO
MVIFEIYLYRHRIKEIFLPIPDYSGCPNNWPDYAYGRLISTDLMIYNSNQPVITSNTRDFYAEKGKSDQMYIEFYSGFSQPLVTWYIIKNGTMELLQNSSNFGMYLSTVTVELKYYQKTVRLPGYNASLEVLTIDQELFTSYKVEIDDSFAQPVFETLHLKPSVIMSTYKSPESSVAGIAGGISAGLVIILVVGIVFVLWKRNQHKKQAKHDTDNGVTRDPIEM